MGGQTGHPRPRGNKGVQKSKPCNKSTYKEGQYKRVHHLLFAPVYHTTQQTHLFHVQCQHLLPWLTGAHLQSRARRRTHHTRRGMRAMCQEIYPTTHHRRKPARCPPHRTRVGISPTHLSRPQHEASAPTCTITHGAMTVSPCPHGSNPYPPRRHARRRYRHLGT